jgi:hypothetical protein
MSTIADLPASARLRAKGETPGGKWDAESFEAYETWDVDLPDLNDFLRVVGGTVEDVGGLYLRVVPLINQDYDFCYAYSVDWRKMGWNRTTDAHWIARCAIKFRTPPWNADWYSLATTGDRRVLRKPAATATGETMVEVPGTAYRVTLHRLPTANYTNWTAYGGYVNSVDWRGNAAGTVYFEPPNTAQQFTVGGTSSFNATLTFRASRIPWNQEFDITGTLYDTGKYPAVDFNAALGV